MWCVTRAATRRYRCGVCEQGLDALAAEVEVWELARTRIPTLGNAHTPYDERARPLASALRAIDVARSSSGHRFVLTAA